MRRLSTWPALVLLGAALAPRATAAEPRQFDYLFMLGTKEGVNPTQKFNSRLGRLVFGPPERESPIVHPTGVTVDRSQRIWIADRAGLVHVFDILEGRYRQLRGAEKVPFECPSGIAADSNGRVYVTDACSARIFVFDEDGVFERFLTGRGRPRFLQQPNSIAVSDDLKTVFVTDSARRKVIVLNQEGERIREWNGPSTREPFQYPNSVAVDSEGSRVYVFDGGAHVVQIFTPAGRHAGSLRWPKVRRPASFAFDAERRLYFVGDEEYNAIMVFDEEGNSAGAFGRSGADLGAMQHPSRIYIDRHGWIYIVDTLGARVLAFQEVPLNTIIR
jgi:DNA-binding beta-propeller fold protein YncE